MTNRKVKVGVLGGGRGHTMIEVMSQHPDADLVAVCDSFEPRLERCRKIAARVGCEVTCYSDFDKFMEHDMDAVVLANRATEHVPFAIRLLDSGRHVCSEVLACQTVGEAVALVEAVERSGKVYAYAENYCYFRGTSEMRRLYQSGALGEFLHGEGEYVHDCEEVWPEITWGNRDHWRNWTPSTFYCTHSIGPIVSITGTRPVRVSAYETPNINSRKFGRRASDGAVLICQMSNGATAKFLPWSGFKRSPEAIWYSVYGTKGMMETDRWGERFNKINVYLEETGEVKSYTPEFVYENELSKSIGTHGGADFYTMDFFLDAILDRDGKEQIIDVYQALDMTLPGTIGYRSIWEGNIPLEIPDLRDKSIREKYRNDDWCVDPAKAGPGQPTSSSSFGPVDVPDSVYEAAAVEFQEKVVKSYLR